MKFSLDHKVEFKNSFKFYCQILVEAKTNVTKNFVYFAWHGLNEQNVANI